MADTPKAANGAYTAPDMLKAQLEEMRKLSEKAMDMFPTSKGSAFQLELAKNYRELVERILQNPTDWFQMQNQFMQDQMQLWMNFWARTYGLEAKPVVEPEKGDRRFNAEAWTTNPVFDFVKQSYLLTSKFMAATLDKYPVKEEDDNMRLGYQMRQFVEAMSPANFAATNPEVMQRAMETNGQSLMQGMKYMLEDIQRGRVTMTDTKAFKVGENIAVTKGNVVYENDLIQLIQYSPTTEQTYEVPLLIIPPWINKFYILDLTAETSFVKYCVDNGITLFMVSWRNPGQEMGNTTWDDYMAKGSLKAMEVVLDICSVPKLNVIGYCIGGTLLTCTLAYLKYHKRDIVNRATYFTALTDFTDVGEIKVFVNESQIKEREREFGAGGVMPGNSMSNAFAFLRANDLVWNYVVNNYLMGKEYSPFDLLYWNGDPTNLPGAMYTYYLRNMYLENNLVKPNKLTMLGTPIDMSQIDVPIMSIAAREDHIAPWKGVFTGMQNVKTDVEFVLGASGHIAGIVNPASKNKREFWYGKGIKGKTQEEWFGTAKNEKGSWWNHWLVWVTEGSGKKIAARTTAGNANYKPIEPAPGRYVTETVPVGGFTL
jgi:polyhydroxyalkanoate synthase